MRAVKVCETMLRLAARTAALRSLPRLACRPLCSVSLASPASHGAADYAADDADVDAEEAVLRFTSDMRPPGDTSRKWVKIDEQGRAYSTGRRKSSSARVWVWETPDGEDAVVTINRQSVSTFFGGHWHHRHTLLSPFFDTGTAGRFSVLATVQGGGLTGQTEAVRLGIATAMQGLDASLRPHLKQLGYLKRDPRRSERKKPGQKGARARFQFSKR